MLQNKIKNDCINEKKKSFYGLFLLFLGTVLIIIVGEEVNILVTVYFGLCLGVCVLKLIVPYIDCMDKNNKRSDI